MKFLFNEEFDRLVKLRAENPKPLILQILGLKRFHDVDTRNDSFSLILSDGIVSSHENIDAGVKNLKIFTNFRQILMKFDRLWKEKKFAFCHLT